MAKHAHVCIYKVKVAPRWCIRTGLASQPTLACSQARRFALLYRRRVEVKRKGAELFPGGQRVRGANDNTQVILL